MVGQGFETTRLIVRLGAVAANYRRFTEIASPACVAGVVKADAYGLGAAATSKALREAGCHTLFVARIEEAVALQPAIPDARIFVLNGVTPETAPVFVAHNLIPVLNSLSEIAVWSIAARVHHKKLKCAIHIDTGMNRLGLPRDELAILSAEAVKHLAGLDVVLWMSHLACGDDHDSPMNPLQLGRFRAALGSLPPAPASLAASGGALLGKDYVFDMIRPGIGLYGGNPLVRGANPFAVAALLVGRILQVRRVDRGESVGYGATFQATRLSKLATVGLGYADGLMRAIGNRGEGAIVGIRAPVVGRVSMDLVTLDVTGVPADALNARAEVEFFGDHISLEEFARWSGTANYEVLTGIGDRVPRIYEEPR